MGNCLLIAALICLTTTEPASVRGTVDTLVICPAPFHSALKTWVDYRTSQGHKILVQTPASTAGGLRNQIRSVAAKNKIKSVVLVGDAVDQNVDPDLLVPTDYIPAKVNVRFGSEPEIATDNTCLLYTSPSPRDATLSRMPSSA